MAQQPKQLNQIREIIRLKSHRIRTERAYIDWMKRFIRFHHKRLSNDMGVTEMQAFLTDLAVNQNVASVSGTYPPI